MSRTVCACLLVVSSGLAWGGASAQIRAPRLELAETVWEFGVRNWGDKESKSVTIRNTGDAPLLIEKVDAECGCVKPRVKPRRIPPGGTGELIMDFDATRGQGEIKKHVTITCNDPRNSRVRFLVHGEIRPAFWVDDQNVRLGRISNGVPTKRKIRVHVGKGYEVALKQVIHHPPDLDVKTIPFEEEDGECGWDLVVTIPAHRESGYFEGMIGLTTDFAARPFLGIRLAAEVIGDIRVAPERIAFGTVAVGKSATRVIRIEKTVGDGMKVLRTWCPESALTTKIVPVEAGKRYEVHATFVPKAAGSFRGKLQIVVDEPGQRVHDVTWSARVTP